MMKKFTIVLLSTVFVALIACSIQSISADDLEPRQEFSKDEKRISLSPIKDSKYKLHVQVVVRNTDNQLITVTETTGGVYVPHKITDDAFDTFMGKMKIVSIDDIKYEKVQFYDSYTKDWDAAYPIGLWVLTMCEEMNSGQDEFECLNIFQARTDQVIVKDEDVITAKWTIFRAMN